jgi:PAS domain S-box-containing protein
MGPLGPALNSTGELAAAEDKRLRWALQAAGGAAWDWDFARDEAWWSDEMHALWGISRGTPVSGAAMAAMMHDDDRNRALHILRSCSAQGLPYFCEFRIQHPTRGVRWMASHGRPQKDASGASARVLGVTFDITESKVAELEQLQLLRKLETSESETRHQQSLFQCVFDSSPDSIVIIGHDCKIVSVNSTFSKVFGYAIDELQGRTTRRLYANEDNWRTTGLKLEEASQLPIEVEHDGVRKNGGVFPCKMTAAAIVDPCGTRLGFVAVVRDVTLERRRERALRDKQGLEALGRLTGGIAHDFNNLLTVISGQLQLLEIKTEKSELQRHITEALVATQMGARLNQRLMSFARQTQLDPKPVDVNSLLGSLLDLVCRAIGETVRVTTALSARQSTVLIDPSEMENAILNLALNARDAMPDGGQIILATTDVNLSAEQAATKGSITPGDYLLISVSDTGAGMTPETLSHAFEPYFTTKDVGKGTGLGLTTIHSFVSQSAGYISLESEWGRGTTVRIYLPKMAAFSTASRFSSERATPDMGGGETILLVEDNPDVRRVTLELLTKLNYRAIEADSGSAALSIIERGELIDLVFSDVVMPGGISGFDLITKLRTVRPDMKVLLVSGFPGTIRRPVEEKREYNILLKPYSFAELAKIIKESLRGPV